MALVLGDGDREDAESAVSAARRVHWSVGGKRVSKTLDLEVGQTASRTMTVTASHVEAYAEMTGDYNPLHFDAVLEGETWCYRFLVGEGDAR